MANAMMCVRRGLFFFADAWSLGTAGTLGCWALQAQLEVSTLELGSAGIAGGFSRCRDSGALYAGDVLGSAGRQGGVGHPRHIGQCRDILQFALQGEQGEH